MPCAAQQNDETKPFSEEDALKLVIVMEQIKQLYVKDISYEKITENAIKGMLSNMDPYSQYLDVQFLKQLENNTKGKFVGVGIEITLEEGEVKVIAPLDQSPASLAGIKSGDFITHVNDKRIVNLTLTEVVEMISGSPGTQVKLGVINPKEKKLREYTITRKKINHSSIKSELIDDVLYIKLSTFAEKTHLDIQETIAKHTKNKSVSSIIVDVRNNPGGLLTSATKTTDLFLDSRKLANPLIVYTQGKSPYSKLDVKATPHDITNGIPMIVLVNEGSASASEIFAGALKDHNRAIIVGRKTFGKGSVQTVLPISENSAVKITTALYYTPLGRVIQGNGVEPDIKVPHKEIASQDNEQLSKIARLMSEKNYVNTIKHTKELTANKKQKSELFKSYAQKDFPLYQAIIILRSIDAYKS